MRGVAQEIWALRSIECKYIQLGNESWGLLFALSSGGYYDHRIEGCGPQAIRQGLESFPQPMECGNSAWTYRQFVRALHSFNTKLASNFPETFPNLDILCQTAFFTSCFRILSECTPPCRRLEIRKRVKPWRELEFLWPPFALTTQRAVTWIHSRKTIGGPKHGAERGMERGDSKFVTKD